MPAWWIPVSTEPDHSGILAAFSRWITPPAAMRRITGKAEDETLIELQSSTDSQTAGNELKTHSFIFYRVWGSPHFCPATLFEANGSSLSMCLLASRSQRNDGVVLLFIYLISPKLVSKRSITKEKGRWIHVSKCSGILTVVSVRVTEEANFVYFN